MHSILMTGGAGYIGSHTVLAAMEQGWQVAVVDDLSTGIRGNLPDDCDFYRVKIQNEAEMTRIMRHVAPEAVIHFAGSIIVPESVTNPVKYYENNTAASLQLIQTCLACNVKTFLFSSTAAVYGNPATQHINEDTATNPINPYGRSKLMTEQILSDTATAHDFTFAALRYFNVAGADPAGRTGQSTPNATHLIKVACEAALGMRPKLPIYGTDYDTPDGTCIRDFIHVTDLARAHMATLDYIHESGKSTIFNCGNGRGYSVREIVDTVRHVSGIDLPVKETTRRAGDPPSLIADATRLQKLTGWQARHTEPAEMVSTALAWEKKLQGKKKIF